MREPYTYKMRLGYGSQNHLIEFNKGVEKEEFLIDLLDEISELAPKVDSMYDLWINDEILVTIDTSIGDFEISKDNWGFAFLISDSNQDGIKTIESILSNSTKFIRFDK